MNPPRPAQPPARPKKRERGLFWLAVAALLALHMLGFDQGGRPLLLGWIPLDLAWRVAWMAAAAGVVFWMTGRLWPDEDEG